jgi:hypothetical protein
MKVGVADGLVNGLADGFDISAEVGADVFVEAAAGAIEALGAVDGVIDPPWSVWPTSWFNIRRLTGKPKS